MNIKILKEIVGFIKKQFPGYDFIPLHEPRFIGNEKKYVIDCIDSTFVSSVGKYVDLFEQMVAEYTGSRYAIAAVNGTVALHTALLLAGVQKNDEVLTQAITFIATANAISYCGAEPVFLDSDRRSLGLSPEALKGFLSEHCYRREDGNTYNKKTEKRIAACVPVHVFGHPVQIDRIKAICERHNIVLLEDAAESVGSFVNGKHTGTSGRFGILSFNGNKIITTGGGGIILTDDEKSRKKARHLTTTAKVAHPWEYIHDEIGFNFRLTNISAALGCAQMETLPRFVENKRELASIYKDFFDSMDIPFVSEPDGCRSNYWLNTIILDNRKERDAFLEYSNNHGVMSRPIWALMPKLTMYSHCQTDALKNARWLEDRVVNIPSSVRV